jgi:chemotaxis protein CheD
MHDPTAGIGGLLHYMLPDSKLDPLRARERPGMFADTGIALLLDSVQRSGARRSRLAASAAGAATILDSDGVFDIGARNMEVLHRILDGLKIPLVYEASGGKQSRSVRLEIDSGRFVVQEGSGGRHTPSTTPVKGGTRACLPGAKFAF